MRILVSLCLLGAACRYDGGSKPCGAVLRLARRHELIPVCPEQLGGLPTPRPPAEIRGEKVETREGADVTAAYRRGAEETLRLYRQLECGCALMKARSPSCGCGAVYDGTFSGTLRPGNGVTAQLLREEGIAVFTEDEAEKLV